MRSRLGIAAVLVGVLAVAAVAKAAAEVGGPPTLDLKRCDKEIRPCGDPVVIGVGRHFVGPVEIVAFQSRLGLCIEVDIIREGGSGSCPGGIHPPEGRAISSGGAAVSFGRLRYTQVEGAVVPGAAAVRVRFRREGEIREARGVIAQVAGELQERLGEEEPFGVFEATVRGCVPVRRIRLAALDASGIVVGRTRIRGGFGRGQCDRTPDFPGTPPDPRYRVEVAK
jgi:hypothetical protein